MIIKADGVPLIFFIWLNMLVVLIYSTRSQLFFFQCSFIYYLSWNVFLRCEKTNLIYVIIQVVKTFRALHCQKCGKYFKKKTKNHRNIQESTFFSFKLNISRFQAPVTTSKNSRNIMVFNSRILSHKTVKQLTLTMKYFLLGKT